MLGFAMFLAKTPMAWLMSGLVQTDRYSKLPTSPLYGNSSKLSSVAYTSLIEVFIGTLLVLLSFMP